MVSEKARRSYAAAVTAEGSGGETLPEQGGIPTGPQQFSVGENFESFENSLFLHITENANAILVSPPLNEENYASWSRSMKMALEVKNKFGLVDGSIPMPKADDPLFPQWKRCNTIVCSWILKSLTPMIAESVMYREIARDIWKDLNSRFSQVDPHRIAELQNQIFNTKQGCSCTLVSKIHKEREDYQVIRFLEGLNEEYENVKSVVLVSDPIPAMDKVFKMALKMERKVNGSLSSNELMHANLTQGLSSGMNDEGNIVAAVGFNNSNGNFNKKRFGNNGKGIPKCTFCGMTGHTIEKRYKKHGYPPGWVPGYKSKPRQNQQDSSVSNVSVSQGGDVGLSTEQFQRLISLLQGQNGQGSSTAAAVTLNTTSLKSNFKGVSEELNEGPIWADTWFC